jgi:hypothetical protein
MTQSNSGSTKRSRSILIVYFAAAVFVLGFVVALLVISLIRSEKPETLPLGQTFEFQFGQGSGLDGLKVVKILPNGEACYDYGHVNAWQKKTFRVSQEAMQELADKINALGILNMGKVVSDPDVRDGVQWIVLIKAGGTARSIYFNNRFPAQVKELATFVHERIVEPHTRNLRPESVSDFDHARVQQELWDSLR